MFALGNQSFSEGASYKNGWKITMVTSPSFALVQIMDTKTSLFSKAWSLYEKSFASEYRRSLQKQKVIMKSEGYHFLVYAKDAKVLGFIALWNLDDFVFIEHLAVQEECRSKGIGSDMVKFVKSATAQGTKVIIEAERPLTPLQERRIHFYENLEFVRNSFVYFQPSYGKNKPPMPLLILSHPRRLSGTEFESMTGAIHRIVYGVN